MLVAESDEPEEVKYKKVLAIVDQMSIAHRETLKFLLVHMLRVTEPAQENSMNIDNMATCWNPSIIQFEDEEKILDKALELIGKKKTIVILLLNTFKTAVARGDVVSLAAPSELPEKSVS